jgi:hypothetical protein
VVVFLFLEVQIMESFCSDNIKELANAMLKVQAEITPTIKDASNPFAKSRYATLNSVINASRDALLKHGVWVVQYPVPVEPGHLELITRLIHASSGQWQSSLMVMPLAKPDPQGYGSALTYARRYSLASMVGLITEDDDAETACGRTSKGNNNQTQKYPQSKPNDPLADKPGNGQSNGSLSSEDVDLLTNLPQPICLDSTASATSLSRPMTARSALWPQATP